jgi:LuxR family maltose regulon positive regulatory protein
MAPPTPTIQGDVLSYQQDGEARTLRMGTPAWSAWLEDVTTFAVVSQHGRFTARKERASNRRGGWYWRAYRKRGTLVRRAYLGKNESLTPELLEAVAARLADEHHTADPPPAPAAAGPAHDPLIATKFAIPSPHTNLLERPRLRAHLAAGALTVVVAPAGFGKTTLLGEWLGHQSLDPRGRRLADSSLDSSLQPPAPRVAWLALDSGDDSPNTFWMYVASAIERACPGAGAAALEMLGRQPAPQLDTILKLLVNAIVAQSDALILVLDDYHLVTTPAIHESLAWLLDRMPTQLRLVIASRTPPALPLARLRASGRLTELGADDLRFTIAEAAALLNQVLGLGLAAADIASLTVRTEGWIVGLRLSALALERHANPAEFIAGFGGTHRYILEYLADEVLGRQTAVVQQFLLTTSVLDRMCPELCDALLDLEARDWGLGAGATSPEPLASSISSPSQPLLEEIERANLFVTPLGGEGRWYRYHPLFADFLRERLRRHYPARVPELHRRAAAWYEQQQLVVPAIAHALAAGDYDRVARLVEERILSMLMRRESALLRGWLEQLPEAQLRARPRLGLAYAAVLLVEGQPDAIEPYLQAAVQEAVRAQPQAAAPNEIQNMLGEVAALRAYAAALEGNVTRAIALAHQALEFLPANNALVRGFAAASLGFATLAGGEIARASQTLADAAAISQSTGNAYLTLVALCSLAYLHSVQGQLHKAAETYRRALRQAEEWGGQLLPVAGWAGVGLAGLLYEWDDLPGAAAALAEGIARCREWGSMAPLLIGYATLARLQQAQEDSLRALATIAEARALAQSSRSQRLGGLVGALQATLWARAGDTAAAAEWAKTCDLRDDWVGFEHGFEHLALARVLILQGRERSDRAPLHEAVWLLDQLLRVVETGGWTGRLVQALALQALAHQALGDADAACALLGRSLALAEPEGYVRTFIDEGAPMAELLDLVVARRPEQAAYASRLRSHVEGPHTSQASQPEGQPLPEPLTARELEVLRLAAAGGSAAEIACGMFLAAGTVKWYLKAIYLKLDVHTRTAAIARARTLGLLH